VDAVREADRIVARLFQRVFLSAALALSLCAGGYAIPLANGGFEDDLAGWQALANGAASVSVSADRPATGQKCAQLIATAGDDAMLVSAPLPVTEIGNPFELQLRVRALSPAAQLSIGLVSATAETEMLRPEPLCTLPAGGDNNWHRLRLTVAARHDPQRPLCLTVTATGEGNWAIDEVELLSHNPPDPQPHEAMADAASYPEPLLADWTPDGLLDARRRQIGQTADLLVDVAGMEISIPEEASCRRGVRQGIDTYCTNRGSRPKRLEVSVQGPADVKVPDWSVPVPPKETMHFYVPVQRLLLGDCWLKITFSYKDSQASVPLLLHTESAYPVLGASWSGEGQPSADALLEKLLPLGAGIQHLVVGTAWEAPANTQSGFEYILSPEAGTLDDLVADLAKPDEAGQRHCWLPYTAESASVEEAGAGLRRLAAYLHKQDHSPNIFSFPYHLQWSEQDRALQLPPDYPLDAISLQECAGNTSGTWAVQSLTLQLPPLPGATVLRAELDGRSLSAPSAYWIRFNQCTDLAPIRQAAQAAGVALPFTVLATDLASSGDRRIDALKLGKTMVNTLYQGATAVLLNGRDTADRVGLLAAADGGEADPVAEIFAALVPELAAARPVVALGAIETMSPRPDGQVTYKLFLRGDEGIVVMWNNTHEPVEVALGLRSQPVTVKLLRLAYYGDFVQQQLQPIFKLFGKALETKQPAIYLRLDPLAITCVSMRLVDPHVSWTRGVFPAEGFKAELPPKERRPRWWERLLF